MDDQDETEETLSFCDLQIYSSTDAADWEKFPEEDQRLVSSSDQDIFEFFSEDWSNSRTSYPDRDIEFYGKLIPCEEPFPIKTTHNLEKETPTKPKIRFPFRWKSNWFSKQRDPKNQLKARFSRSKSVPEKLGRKVGKYVEKYVLPLQKLSIVDSPMKLLVFGFGVRVSAEMKLSDIKSRQSKRNPPTGLFLGSDGRDKKLSGGKGLWVMIRALGCSGGNRSNAVEEAHFGIVPSTHCSQFDALV